MINKVIRFDSGGHVLSTEVNFLKIRFSLAMELLIDLSVCDS